VNLVDVSIEGFTYAPNQSQGNPSGGKAAQKRGQDHEGAHEDLDNDGDVLEGARRGAVQLVHGQSNQRHSNQLPIKSH